MRKTLLLTPLFAVLIACHGAAVTQDWVARYNGGFTNKTHTPLAITLDSSGNIYVAGSSQNASNYYDYAVLKYAPDGSQLWASRYSSTNGGDYTVKSFALDKNNNAFVTGSGGTVKFNANGTLGWTAPYSGNGIAVDTNGDAYVTGFSASDFATVKLDSAGSNVWVRTYDKIGLTDISQAIAVDKLGGVYVAGWETWSGQWGYAKQAVLKYDTAGNSVWTNELASPQAFGETKGLIADGLGNVYVTGNVPSQSFGYLTTKINSGGQKIWIYDNGPPGVTAMVLDTNLNIYLTGGRYSGFAYGTFKLDNSGNMIWESYYFGTSSGYSYNRANNLALDNLANVYVTGISTNTGTSNDFATIKYATNGNQLWVIRYDDPTHGDDGAMAIAVASDGSIYVTGYSANEFGGSDITTIKYTPNKLNIEKQSNGSMRLKLLGDPGQVWGFETGTNLSNWQGIGTNTADLNGNAQFDDTNASPFPPRFYRGVSPP